MHPKAVSAAMIALFAAAGCGKDDPTGSKGGRLAVVELQVITPPTGGPMVLAPGGTFTMGDADGGTDETSHEVSVDAFYIDRYPVTQELYQHVMKVNPSKRKDPKSPVEQVTWTAAVRFCNKVSEMEGLTACYDLERWVCNFDADGYRLPTEAEWEYACRAGSTTDYFYGDDPARLADFSWSKPQSRGKTHPVGGKHPNRWGLYDMHGNVWEWCNDWYGEGYYVESPRENPRGPGSGKQRVIRGGAWKSPPDRCRAAYRAKEFPVYKDACFGADSYGFRRVRSAKPGKAAAPTARAVETPAGPEKEPTRPVAAHTTGKIDPVRLKGSIIYVSDRSGSLDIWRMHADGRHPKPLTRDEHPDADPRFSPDGERILYTTVREGFPQVWTMKRDGSGGRKITDGRQATWSADGKSVLFIRDDQAWIRELASGTDRRITPRKWNRCGTPAWSPDGNRVAVASRHEGDIAIYLLATDGSAASKIVTEDSCCTPAWSADGKRLLFQTDKGHIHEIGADGRNEEQLTFGADVQHEGRYSPDATMVVFCRAPSPQGPWQICILDLQSDNLDFIQITRKGSNRLPDWHSRQDD